MPYQPQLISIVHPDLVDHDSLARRVRELLHSHLPRYARLWNYYRNPMTTALASGESGRPYQQGQEWGMPSRITGRSNNDATTGLTRKEVVVENDIAWRIDTMVDFLFGRSVQIESRANDPARKRLIEETLQQIIQANGDSGFFQRLALLGSVYGFVDVMIKFENNIPSHHPDFTPVTSTHTTAPLEDLKCLAGCLRWEIVEPPRALAIVDETDPTRVVAHAQVWRQRKVKPASRVQATPARSLGLWQRLSGALPTDLPGQVTDDSYVTVVELVSPGQWQRYEDEVLVAAGKNTLERLPLIHIQNVALPFEYAGASDVEGLIPLQDELNTRLSDRAYRITMQSSKMYLGKGIADFASLPVSPGRMWSTDNLEASVIEFGGDASCPSEIAHIADVREALDKQSGVSPIAAGAIRGRIGRLTSAAALRVTFLSLLARTTRKHLTYGPAIAQACELSLAWLDHAGLFHTTPEERRVDIHWPSPIPEGDLLRLDEVSPEVAEERDQTPETSDSDPARSGAD